MKIHIKDDLKRRLATRASESGFDSVEAYVESLIRADAGDEQVVADEDLERMLLDRIDDEPTIEVTPQFVDEFKKQIARRRSGESSA